MGTRPAATAAAEPPEEPPGVFPNCHGLCVSPLSFVLVQLMPPNSLEVVDPIGTAPLAITRSVTVPVWSEILSAKTNDASV
jgi:hypothetical protein